ncbi:MAG TPA: hypothetical protein VGX71_05890 [Pseudaminobacter sp.]|nr:hypothetical protein [Pseudaminobacter sp.]
MTLVTDFSQDVASATPYLEHWVQGRDAERSHVAARSQTAVDLSTKRTAESRYGTDPEDASFLVRTMLVSATTAKQIQAVMGLELVIMEVELSTAPTVKLCYLRSIDEAKSTFQLIDLNRHVAIRSETIDTQFGVRSPASRQI